MSYAVASLCICHVHLRACGSHPRWVALEEVIHRTLSWRVLCNINLFRAYRLYYRRCPSALLIRDTLQLDAPAGRYQPRVPGLGVPPAGVTTYNEDLFLPQGPLAVLLVSALLLSDVHRMDCIDQIAVVITYFYYYLKSMNSHTAQLLRPVAASPTTASQTAPSIPPTAGSVVNLPASSLLLCHFWNYSSSS